MRHLFGQTALCVSLIVGCSGAKARPTPENSTSDSASGSDNGQAVTDAQPLGDETLNDIIVTEEWVTVPAFGVRFRAPDWFLITSDQLVKNVDELDISDAKRAQLRKGYAQVVLHAVYTEHDPATATKMLATLKFSQHDATGRPISAWCNTTLKQLKQLASDARVTAHTTADISLGEQTLQSSDCDVAYTLNGTSVRGRSFTMKQGNKALSVTLSGPSDLDMSVLNEVLASKQAIDSW